MANMHDMLRNMVDKMASDLHLTAGLPPMYRIDGKLTPFSTERLVPDDVLKLCYSIMNEHQRKIFEQKKEVDFSFGVQSLARFRANVYVQRGCASAALRVIPTTIKSVEELGLPKTVSQFSNKPNGLVLVTGPTGSGKSTTLAAMIDKVNSEREEHILTIEDPIEFVHPHKKCMVSQREVFQDTDSFTAALRVALRQDPDIVLIGEMRDLETIRAALTIAETGHLTFATLHTNSAAQTISRIIDVFPAEEKDTVRMQLSMVLQGIVSQALLPQIGGGRVVATEILVCTPAISALIRDEKIHQITGMLEIGQQYGMQTMNQDLSNLVFRRRITKADALKRSPNPEALEKLIGGK
ncbi:MAG: PilT/PilU family type 4a pilus ATPase [Chitinivibrionales bacterium]|nr:PilT/PilU family type 4a pilus ATPase [Chitinivibrionales bacterium]